MRWECWDRFPCHQLQMKPLVSNPGMHHGTCITHVHWCMSGSLTCVGRENVPSIPGACATRNFTYLVRGPLHALCRLENAVAVDDITKVLEILDTEPQLARSCGPNGQQSLLHRAAYHGRNGQDGHFQTWPLIGWQHNCQPIRSHVKKWPL